VSSASPATRPFRFCLNTSTIAGQGLSVVDQIMLAGWCGYDGVEIWMRSIHEHLDAGGSIDEIATAAERGEVTIENVIGFVPWAVDDSDKRAAGLTEADADLEILRAIGIGRMAAPPFGAVDQWIPADSVAARFDDLVERCEPYGVVPLLELWGFSATLGNLGHLLEVAGAATVQPVELLLDAYHLHRGGSAIEWLDDLDGDRLPIFHLNDFPTDRPREELTDADRVLPGHGDAPLGDIIRSLAAKPNPPVLSIELFNRELWQEPAEDAATAALDSMRSAVARALR